ncbi:MAG: Fic family protein [Methanosarcinales archaeon]|nr:Fic family protein [Methanosarcinales archaeon]
MRLSPSFTITPAIARGLMKIEAARALVEHAALPLSVEAELRRKARLRSVHFSTRIEGNRLTLDEARRAIEEEQVVFSGRERDVLEVRNYWSALPRVEEWAARKRPFTEELIQGLHALVQGGPKSRPTPYRDGQNAVRDAASGALIYLPPQAEDVPALMRSLVQWAAQAEEEGLPVPVIAGVVHYQFVTIHPYYDGNGRTARLLATFLLHRGGYGLNGFLSLEEHHARDLAGYYQALMVHPHHNYYEGRAEAEITPWLEYFISSLAQVFQTVREEALRWKDRGFPAEPEELRHLDHRARVVLGLFARRDKITSADVAGVLGLSPRMARNLLRDWTASGILEVAQQSRRGRSYRLSAIYRQYIGTLSARREDGDESEPTLSPGS